MDVWANLGLICSSFLCHWQFRLENLSWFATFGPGWLMRAQGCVFQGPNCLSNWMVKSIWNPCFLLLHTWLIAGRQETTLCALGELIHQVAECTNMSILGRNSNQLNNKAKKHYGLFMKRVDFACLSLREACRFAAGLNPSKIHAKSARTHSIKFKYTSLTKVKKYISCVA